MGNTEQKSSRVADVVLHVAFPAAMPSGVNGPSKRAKYGQSVSLSQVLEMETRTTPDPFGFAMLKGSGVVGDNHLASLISKIRSPHLSALFKTPDPAQRPVRLLHCRL
jgi:hypothetical protein